MSRQRYSKRKGKKAELECWRALGAEIRPRADGGDIDRPPYLHDWWVEIKRRERLAVGQWWKQAVEYTEKYKKKHGRSLRPMVAFRQNRGEWLCVLRLIDFREIVEIFHERYYSRDTLYVIDERSISR